VVKGGREERGADFILAFKSGRRFDSTSLRRPHLTSSSTEYNTMQFGSPIQKLWAAQFFSLLGTEITKFSLRIWTFQSTQSTMQFALITFFSEIPAILVSPLTGGWIDMFSRKRLMLISDSIAALATFVLFVTWTAGNLNVNQVYVANIVQAVANSIQWPSFIATTSLMVDKKDLVKVNGYSQAANGLSMMIAPMIAGYLLNDGKKDALATVFFIEFVTFAIAFIITFYTKLPEVKQESKLPTDSMQAIRQAWSSSKEAWAFIRQQPALLALLVLLAEGMFMSGLVQILMTPLVLGFGTPLQLGNVLTFSGIGAMLGFALPAYVGDKVKLNKIRIVLVCMAIQSLLLAAVGLFQHISWILMIATTYMLLVPLNRALRESIWQDSTPQEMQGRVFSLQQSIHKLALPIASLIAGPICDFFEPRMQGDGWLTHIFWWMGRGKGRGAAVVFTLAGIVNLSTVLLFSANDKVWSMDTFADKKNDKVKHN
jgi:DHA3 family macrolide efflux protein-like MFS transporter